MSRIADTSLLYAAFDSADTRHRQALDEIAKPQPLDVPLAVLAEFLDLLEYRHGEAKSRQVWADLSTLANLSVPQIASERRALDLWVEHTGISMADAVGIQACIESGGRLLSYDERQLEVLATLRRGKKKGRA